MQTFTRSEHRKYIKVVSSASDHFNTNLNDTFNKIKKTEKILNCIHAIPLTAPTRLYYLNK